MEIRPDLLDLHVPTGHITLADVVRFLIEDLGVRPRRGDWADILARAAQ